MKDKRGRKEGEREIIYEFTQTVSRVEWSGIGGGKERNNEFEKKRME